MRTIMKLLTCTALFSGMMIGPSLANTTYTFKLVKKIALPTKPGHGDWVSYDPSNGYIYVSMVDGMAVIDTKTNKVVHSFDGKDIPSPNCLAFDKDYVYETVAQGKGKLNQIVVIDKKSWKIVNRVTTAGTSPDGVFIDADNSKLYVVSDDANWIEAYSTGSNPKHLANYPEQPKDTVDGPDVAGLYAGKIYASNDSYIERIDPTTGNVELAANYRLKLTKHGATKGSFWDDGHKAVWVATTHHTILVVDPKTLDIVNELPQTKGTDQVAYDPGLGLAYSFEGGLPGFDVYSVKDEKYLTSVKTGDKHPTHTGTVDTATHNVYAYVGGSAEMWVYQPISGMTMK
jgi:DNA-binding beta-propeller fold protein YncE